MPGDVSKSSKLSSFDGRQFGLLWAKKCCSHVPDELVGLMLYVRNAEQSSETFMFMYPAFGVLAKRQCVAAVKKD